MCRDFDHSRFWLGIFVKEPLPGKVKTRLCPPFSPAQAARLYEASLRETVAAMTAPGLSFRVVLCPAGDPAWFRREFPELPVLEQGAGDLGERMARILAALLQRGAKGAALIGSDSPDLPPSLVESALDALAGAEAVLAPAADGGYVLVGESRHRPELFRDVPWSTPEVMAVTRSRCQKAGIVCREIGGWDDLDDLPSLHRLLKRAPDCATARLARLLIGDLPQGCVGGADLSGG